MPRFWLLFGLVAFSLPAPAIAAGKVVSTPYTEQKVVFEFFLDEPKVRPWSRRPIPNRKSYSIFIWMIPSRFIPRCIGSDP